MTRGGVKNTRLEAKDTKKFRGQGPRTQTQVFSKKKGLKTFFSGDLKKKVFKNFFQAKKVFKNFFSGDLYLRKPKRRSLQIFRKVSGVFQRNFKGSKIVLSSSRGQGNFRGLEASRPRPRTSICVLEAKDILEESTFDFDIMTKRKYLYASDVALQCMYIQFNACIQFIALQCMYI